MQITLLALPNISSQFGSADFVNFFSKKKKIVQKFAYDGEHPIKAMYFERAFGTPISMTK